MRKGEKLNKRVRDREREIKREREREREENAELKKVFRGSYYKVFQGLAQNIQLWND